VLVLLDLESDILPVNLLKKKKNSAQNLARLCLGGMQIVEIAKFLNDFLKTNMFTSCWKEVRETVQKVRAEGGEVGLDESGGVLRVRLLSEGHVLVAAFVYEILLRS